MKKTRKKVPHFSKRKFRLLLRMFCKGCTALQIADFTNLNRNSVNLWVNRIRHRIKDLVEQEKMRDAKHVQMDETYFTKSKEYHPKLRLWDEEVVVFAVLETHGRVYARIVEKVNKRQLLPIVEGCCAVGATTHTDGHTVYKALEKRGYKHASVNHSNHEFSRYENGECITTNGIEGFFGLMKSRLTVFRGVKWDNLDVHVAESVWRFNHRQENLYKLLLKEFRARPLS